MDLAIQYLSFLFSNRKACEGERELKQASPDESSIKSGKIEPNKKEDFKYIPVEREVQILATLSNF